VLMASRTNADPEADVRIVQVGENTPLPDRSQDFITSTAQT
jgi:hypothetical protein